MSDRNIAAEMVEKARSAAKEFRDMAKQIITPVKSKARDQLNDMAFAIEWLIEDHSTVWALSDSLHEGLCENVRLWIKMRNAVHGLSSEMDKIDKVLRNRRYFPEAGNSESRSEETP